MHFQNAYLSTPAPYSRFSQYLLVKVIVPTGLYINFQFRYDAKKTWENTIVSKILTNAVAGLGLIKTSSFT